ncbi:engulfment and cell motility protein [Anaeramoeba ignava]|uniref:Engulfment and cell motility protein n=1 Tax=Anaeramoeba ignava TaxID=1746090 RepID=A0A9Q0LDL6_ANAIG|nr:engulfment and cell motility protein [Anaeramoeba ignava]
MTTQEPENIRKIRESAHINALKMVIEKLFDKLNRGTVMEKHAKSGKPQLRLFKFSDDRKQILSSEVTKGGKEKDIFQLEVKIDDIKQVLPAKSYPSFKPSKKIDEEKMNISFCIIRKDDSVNLYVSPNKADFATWLDFLRFLLNEEVGESETLKEIKEIEDIDVAIELMERSKRPPPIPDPPKNLNFVLSNSEMEK